MASEMLRMISYLFPVASFVVVYKRFIGMEQQLSCRSRTLRFN